MVRGNLSKMRTPQRILWALRLWALLPWLIAAPVAAQSPMPGGMPPPAGMSLAQSAAMRFPQPVRAGDLLHRLVLRPVESQDILGRVRAIVRDAHGDVSVVMNFGGFYGFGGRLIAVPIDAMVLLGEDMEVVAYTPRQLASFPTFVSAGTVAVSDDAVLRVGLAKPSH
jgi:hypothetical protein